VVLASSYFVYHHLLFIYHGITAAKGDVMKKLKALSVMTVRLDLTVSTMTRTDFGYSSK
jgi:hypothetical protein